METTHTGVRTSISHRHDQTHKHQPHTWGCHTHHISHLNDSVPRGTEVHRVGFALFFEDSVFFLPFRKTMYWSYSVIRSLSGHNAGTSSYQLVPLFLFLHSSLHLIDHVSQSVIQHHPRTPTILSEHNTYHDSSHWEETVWMEWTSPSGRALCGWHGKHRGWPAST